MDKGKVGSIIFFVIVVLFTVFSLFSPRSSNFADTKKENFELFFSYFADDPEDYISLYAPYNRTKNLEDAFTKLYCYLYKEPGVTWNEADDAWIYISHYIDALHSEIRKLYNEYDEIY